ncbi:hypothetical protein IFM89_031410 [Coptis chinensis]|uniref:Mediator of RNA polymerase II transcription subunit 11 n=1 Tax=Coptis chinensis TaxID=261450 RepID=A0A835HI66_9MAGN|nr:hypothetical protein IFM89_031410 [Coptis chinensis]
MSMESNILEVAEQSKGCFIMMSLLIRVSTQNGDFLEHGIDPELSFVFTFRKILGTLCNAGEVRCVFELKWFSRSGDSRSKRTCTFASHMDSQSQNTSLQKLHNVEKRIVRVLEIAGGVMDELSNSTGPRVEIVNNHCREFMQSIKLSGWRLVSSSGVEASVILMKMMDNLDMCLNSS